MLLKGISCGDFGPCLFLHIKLDLTRLVHDEGAECILFTKGNWAVMTFEKDFFWPYVRTVP